MSSTVEMKKITAGDLVRYSSFPHKELHESGMVGLAVSDPYRFDWWNTGDKQPLVCVDVIWNADRLTRARAGHILQEYVQELEAINSH